MSNTTESNERVRPESGEVSSKIPATSALRPTTRWTRTRTIWTLMLLSLMPGIGVSLFRGYWEEQVPPAVRIATYVISGILIVAACGLIITTSDTRTAEDRSSPPPKDG